MRIVRKLFYPNTEYCSQVNIVPVIAKADTINKPELAKFKSKVMQELTNNGVQIYQFPTDDETIRFVTKSCRPKWTGQPFLQGVTPRQTIQNRDTTVIGLLPPWGQPNHLLPNNCYTFGRSFKISFYVLDLRTKLFFALSIFSGIETKRWMLTFHSQWLAQTTSSKWDPRASERDSIPGVWYKV